MQTFKEHSPAILGIAVLVLLASTCRAQATASISGTVHDVTGAVVPGANVVAINEANKARWTTTSNGLGFFSFSALQPATYTLRVTRKNFETWYVTGIVVHPGDDLTVPKIALKVGATDVTVTVTANLAGVTLNSPEHSTLITSGDIDRLSTIGRDVDELLATQPGFTLNAGTDMQNEGPGGLYGYQTVGPGSGQLGSWGAGGAAPQQGMVSLKSDGANLIDPGDMGGQMSNVNMDQVQEVKISTSNFGADQSNGPIVIDAVGKTGSTQYHGGIYSYFRNRALNSNDWLNKYYGNARPGFRYAYPGGTLGGPVMIPHTNFATKKNLVFWAGMEVYRQLMPESLLTSFVPSSSMIGGNLSSANIAQALNVSETDLLANCSADYSVSATYNPAAGFCWSPNGSTDATGNTVSNGQLTYIDPGIPAITSLWPQANRTPQPVITGGALQYATDAVNYTDTPSSTHNGFQFHTSEDYSMTDTLKLHVVYNWERVNDEEQENNIYYNPGNTVPFPTQMYSYGHNQSLSLNLTKVVGSSLTNELVAAGVYYYQPDQFGNPAKAQLSGTAWEAAGYTAGNPALGLPSNSQIPRIITYDNGIPGFSFGFIPQPPSSQFLRKFNWSLADNLTKVYRTHTFKIGYYMDRTGNNNINLGSQENGTATFMRWDTCYINQPYSPTATAPVQTNLGNVIGNFLNGCPLGFSQDTSDPIENLRFASMEGYGTDEWKVSSKLTLTLGMRFSHLDPWTDAHGIGLAVWKPLDWMNGAPLMQHTVYSDTASNATWPGISWHKRDPEHSSCRCFHPAGLLLGPPGHGLRPLWQWQNGAPRRMGSLSFARCGQLRRRVGDSDRVADLQQSQHDYLHIRPDLHPKEQRRELRSLFHQSQQPHAVQCLSDGPHRRPHAGDLQLQLHNRPAGTVGFDVRDGLRGQPELKPGDARQSAEPERDSAGRGVQPRSAHGNHLGPQRHSQYRRLSAVSELSIDHRSQPHRLGQLPLVAGPVEQAARRAELRRQLYLLQILGRARQLGYGLHRRPRQSAS